MHRNRQSTFSPLKPFIPLPHYFNSEWSYAQYRIPSQSSHISLSTPPSKPPTADVVDEEKCIVGWIQVPSEDHDQLRHGSSMEHQLIALTYTGSWYRLALPKPQTSPKPAMLAHPSGSGTAISASPPSVRAISMARPRSSSGSSFAGRLDKGKEREREKEGKDSHECTLIEFRRFGRWDGWG